MILVDRPFAVFGVFAIVPAVILVAVRVKVISKSVGTASSRYISGFKKAVFARIVFRSIAWIMLLLAYAGISWGTYRVPIQKNGNAVSFVFDISYSMNADDCAGGITRLQSAANYAEMLLDKLDGVAVSVVIAKGDGILAVPLTEDIASVSEILQVLSPALMTAPGSSLGTGVMTALRSFSSESQSGHIWLFTDGDETDGSLSSALDECERHGISVAIIGFGGSKEVQVVSGDGATPAMTALRSSQLDALVQKKGERIIFVDSAKAGSAVKIFDMLKSDADSGYARGIPVIYETQTVPRHRLFLTLAIIFFILGFVVSDFLLSIKPKGNAGKKITLGTVCLSCFIFLSCGAKFNGAKEILYGAWSYQQRNYHDAIGHFLRASDVGDENDLTDQYAHYGLAVTYMADQEYEAARIRLSQISPDAHPSVQYAAFFANGVIAYNSGDYAAAADFFRAALKIDASNVDAKINLELTLRNLEAQNARAQQKEMLPVSHDEKQNTKMERAIFERIRENDIQRWKNSEQSEISTNELDY